MQRPRSRSRASAPRRLTDMAGDTFSGNTRSRSRKPSSTASALLHAADDDTASLHLTVTASTSEGTSSASSAAQTINLTDNPVAEAPVLTASAAATSVGKDGRHNGRTSNITATTRRRERCRCNDLGLILDLGTATLTDMAGDTFSGNNAVTLTRPSSTASPCTRPTTTPRAWHLTVTASASEAHLAARPGGADHQPDGQSGGGSAAVLTAVGYRASVNEDSGNVAGFQASRPRRRENDMMQLMRPLRSRSRASAPRR